MSNRIITNITEQFATNEIDFLVMKGDDFQPNVLEVVNVDSADAETPFDLTGYSGLMEVKNKATDTFPLLTFTTADTTMTFGGANGNEITLLEVAANMGLEAQEYTYDLQVTSGAGIISTLFKGKFIIAQDVS